MTDPQSPAHAESLAPSPLARFQVVLETLQDKASDVAVLGQAWDDLERLEVEIGKAWDEFVGEVAEPSEPQSGAAAAARRELEEGFQRWFEAFDHARVGEASQAMDLAREATTKFRSVADWSHQGAL